MSKGKIMVAAAVLLGFIALGMWGSPMGEASVIPHPDVRVKAIPSFSADIKPVFERYCTRCHTGPMAPLGLDLSTYRGVMRGSALGPMVIPGHPELSNLVVHIKKEVDPSMWRQCFVDGRGPSPNEVKNLERWILTGARNN